MGCRGTVGFRTNNVDKVTYTHWGGCPDGAGAQAFKFVQKNDDDALLKTAESIQLIDGNTPPTVEQIALCHKLGFVDLTVSERSEQDWYCLLRHAQDRLDVPFMEDYHAFMADSLFCEGAYIINLDTKTLEVYAGFNKNQNAKGRYASLRSESDRHSGYYGVRLIWEIPFADVRNMSVDEFINTAQKLLGDE